MDPGFLISQHIPEGDTPLPFISANLTFYNDPTIGTPLPFTVFEVNGIKVGVTSVMSQRQKQTVIPQRAPDEESSADVQWTDPVAALKQVLSKLDEQALHSESCCLRGRSKSQPLWQRSFLSLIWSSQRSGQVMGNWLPRWLVTFAC